MNTVDLTAIIGNLARSLSSVESLVAGLGYLLGILFIIQGLLKLKRIGEARGGGSQESMLSALLYLLIGGFLLFLPSAIHVFSNSTFGAGNVLQYNKLNPYDIYSSMEKLIQTAGLIWFVRGCVLLVHGNDPGAETEGVKGLTFIAAGILAMNFESTAGAINYIMNGILNFTNTGHSTTSSGS